MKYFAIFLRLVDFILDRLESAGLRKKQEKAQGKRDEIEANPGKWFSDHFGGLRRNRQEEPSENDKTN